MESWALPMLCSHTEYWQLGCVGILWTQGIIWWRILGCVHPQHDQPSLVCSGLRGFPGCGIFQFEIGTVLANWRVTLHSTRVLSSHFTGGLADSLQTAPESCPQIPELSFTGCLRGPGANLLPPMFVFFYHLFLFPSPSLQATIQTGSLCIFLFVGFLTKYLLCYLAHVFSVALCCISEQ